MLPKETELLRSALLGMPVCWPETAGEEEEVRFLENTLEHGIQPLLYHRLKESGALRDWPERIQSTLSEESMRLTVLETMMQIEVKEVLASLAEAGICPLLMKGTPLCYTHYPLPNLRFRSDTDLLIRKSELDLVDRIMNRLGYSRYNLVSGELVNHQAAYRKIDSRGMEHDFDFHWRISNPHIFANSISYEELEGSAVRVAALGEKARALGPVHSLFLACIHRVAHHQDTDRIIWLYDIHLLAAGMSRSEFEEFLKLAAEKKVRAICLKGLSLARDWFKTDLPEDLIDRWLLSDKAEESERYLNSDMRRLDILVSDLENLSGWRKLQLLKEHAFPPADYMFSRYSVTNRLLLPALYLHRGVTGAWKWFRSLKDL
jgi:hypothetical protein